MFSHCPASAAADRDDSVHSDRDGEKSPGWNRCSFLLGLQSYGTPGSQYWFSNGLAELTVAQTQSAEEGI